MKSIFIILLLLVSVRVLAPTNQIAYLLIPESKPIIIDPYQPLKHAIGMVECKMDTSAINPIEQAYGYFQIRPIRLNDYNRRNGTNYSLSDMLIYENAEKVFMYYATQIGHEHPGQIARSWNGSGPKTWDYWNKVKIYLII